MSAGPPARAFDLDPEGRHLPRRAGPLVRPRPAATLLLLDHADAAPRVLMGRRHGGHDFMPDKWVFPGGRVDRADFRTPAASELSPDATAALARTLPPRPLGLARALAIAAVRETWEEAGLALGRPRPGLPPLPDLHALTVLARAVTPPYRPKRFDAVFFMADAGRLASRDRGESSGELDELAWFTLEAAARLDLPSVTRFVLGELAQRLSDPAHPPLHLRYVGKSHRAEPF